MKIRGTFAVMHNGRILWRDENGKMNFFTRQLFEETAKKHAGIRERVAVGEVAPPELVVLENWLALWRPVYRCICGEDTAESMGRFFSGGTLNHAADASLIGFPAAVQAGEHHGDGSATRMALPYVSDLVKRVDAIKSQRGGNLSLIDACKIVLRKYYPAGKSEYTPEQLRNSCSQAIKMGKIQLSSRRVCISFIHAMLPPQGVYGWL